MNRAALAATALALTLTACTSDAPTRPDAAAPALDRGGTSTRSPTSQGIARLKRVGDPIWRPVDCHLFAAPVGEEFSEFFQVLQGLLPPPNHVLEPPLGIAPGAPHAPPYDRELAAGVTAGGFVDRHVFGASQFTGTNAIFFACMLVPAPGVTGTSPDFASGPIIPNSLFPIHIEGVATRNGEAFDLALTNLDVPPLTASIDPRFADVEGHSHFPYFLAENLIFGPPGTTPQGLYRYAIAMRDQLDNGWNVTVQFVVRKKG